MLSFIQKNKLWWLVRLTQRSWDHSRRKEEGISTMSSSLVLLTCDGVVARKLQFVVLPKDYVVPEGLLLSWRMDIQASSSDPLDGWRGPREPVEAYFYFGSAQGQICRHGFKESEQDQNFRLHFACRRLVATVQGTSAKDVMELRERIMQIVHSGRSWGIHNDLNPQPKQGLLQRFKKVVGLTQ